MVAFGVMARPILTPGEHSMSDKHRVLVIDDSKLNRVMLSHLLSDAGYIVDEAVDGEEGITLASKFSPDVVLLDINMPGIDGYETCRRMRATPKLSQAKIIMLSARNLSSERLKGYECGADDYVTKPFEAEELLAKVRVYARLRSLEEVEQVKNCVIEVLQHTTRTPLTNILCYAEMLTDEGELDSELRQQFGEVIHRNANRLRRMLEKSESLAKMKSGNFQFNCEHVDLGSLVDGEVQNAEIEAARRSISISSEIADQAWCHGDGEQLQFAVSAVLDNAVRFSPDDGQIMVLLESVDEYWRIRVTDSGPGISPEIMSGVFDALANPAAPLLNSGDGLSLCIVREISSAHNGRIDAENDSAAGATFTLELPVSSSPASNARLGNERSIESGQGEPPQMGVFGSALVRM